MKTKLTPVPMGTFWGCVAVNMSRVVGRKITNINYVADICRGNKQNTELSPIVKSCVKKTLADLRIQNMRPRYPV